MSRRPGARFNRGRIATVAGSSAPTPPAFGPLDPLSIVTSSSALVYLIADLGVTDAGAGAVSAWADQSGNLNDATQGTGSSQPTLQAGALGGKNSILWDGTADHLAFPTLDLPAPPLWIWFAFKQLSWTAGDSICGASASVMRLQSSGVSPQLFQRNSATTGPLNGDAVVGTWVRAEASFSNSIADYLRFAAGAAATGINTGASNPLAGAFCLGSHTAAAGFFNMELAVFSIWPAEPPGAERLNLDAWLTGYYSGLVGV